MLVERTRIKIYFWKKIQRRLSKIVDVKKTLYLIFHPLIKWIALKIKCNAYCLNVFEKDNHSPTIKTEMGILLMVVLSISVDLIRVFKTIWVIYGIIP